MFVQVEEAAITDPTLVFSSTAATLEVTPAATTQTATFTITGYNLADGDYDLTVPTVDGLTVSPTSVTVADNSLSQEVTVTYAPTADTDAATAEISLTIGELTATNTISYSAKVTAYEQVTIEGDKKWDFAECGYSGNYQPTEAITEPTLYANLGIGIDNEAFDGTSLAWQGTTSYYAIRNGNSSNQGTLSFKTSVPGRVNVTISDTGNSGSTTKRYLVVNDNQTVFYTLRDGSKDQRTTGDVYVSAGDVTITGSASIYIYDITFTAADNETRTLGTNGYSTFTSDYACTVSGATAYAASIDEEGTTVTLTEIEGVIPAGEGVVLKGTEGDVVTIVPATETAASFDNSLVGVSDATRTTADDTFSGDTQYVLASNGTETAFIQKASTTTAVTLLGKAYLPVSSTAAKTLNIVFDSETTGICNVAVEAETATGAIYNLAGQQVSESYKGVVVKNGKKYVNR